MLESKNSFQIKMFPDAMAYALSTQRTDSTDLSSLPKRLKIDAFQHHPISDHIQIIPRLLEFLFSLSPLMSSTTSTPLPLSSTTIANILEWYCINKFSKKNFHFQTSFPRGILQHTIQFVLYHIATVHLKPLLVPYASKYKCLPSPHTSDTQMIQIFNKLISNTRRPYTITQKNREPFLHCDMLPNDNFWKNTTQPFKKKCESLCLIKPHGDNAFMYQPFHCYWAFSLEWILLACNMNQQIIQLTNLLRDQQTFHKQWMRKKNCQINRLSSFIKQISHELCLSTEAFRLLYKQLEIYNAQEKQRNALYSKNQSLLKMSSSLAHINPFPFPNKTLTFLKQTSNERLNQEMHEQTRCQLMSSKFPSSFEKFRKSKSNSFTIGVGVKISDPCLPPRCVSNTAQVQFYDNLIPESTQTTCNVKEISLVSFSLDDKQECSYTKKLREPLIIEENNQHQSYSLSLYGTNQDASCHDTQVKPYTRVESAANGLGSLESYAENQQKPHQMNSNELHTSVDVAPCHINTEDMSSNDQGAWYPSITVESRYRVDHSFPKICAADSYSSVLSVPCRKTVEQSNNTDKEAFPDISLKTLYATRKEEFYPFSKSTHDDIVEDALYQSSIGRLNLTDKDVLSVTSTLKRNASNSEKFPSLCIVEPCQTIQEKLYQMSSEIPYTFPEEESYQSNEETHDDTCEDALYQTSIGRLTSTDKAALREKSTIRSYSTNLRESPELCTVALYATREKGLHHVSTDKPHTTAETESHRRRPDRPYATCKEKWCIKGSGQPYATDRNDFYKSCTGKPYGCSENAPHNIAMMETKCSVYGVSHHNVEHKKTETMSYPDSVLEESLELSKPEILCNTLKDKTPSGLINHKFSMLQKKSFDLEEKFFTAEIHHMKPLMDASSSKETKKYPFFNRKQTTMYNKEAQEPTKSCLKKKKELASSKECEFISLEAYDEMVCSVFPFDNIAELDQIPCSFFNKNCLNTNNSNEMSKNLKPIENALCAQKCTNKSAFVSNKQNDFLTEHLLDSLSLKTTIEKSFNSKLEWENGNEEHCRRTYTKYCQDPPEAYQNEIVFDKKRNRVVASTKCNNAFIKPETFLSIDKATTLTSIPVYLHSAVKKWNTFWWHQQNQLETFFKQRSTVTKIELLSQQLPLPYRNYDKNRVVIIATDTSPFQLKKSIGKYGDWNLLEKILVSLPPVDPGFFLDVKAWIWVATKKILFLTAEQEKNKTELTVILDKTIRNMLTESQCLSTLNMKELGYSTFEQFNEELKNFSVSSQCRFSKFIDSFLPINENKETQTFIDENFLKPTYVTKQLFLQSIQYLGHSMNRQCSTTVIVCCGIGHFFKQENTVLSTTGRFQSFAEKNLQTDSLKSFVHKQSNKEGYTLSELVKSSSHDWIQTAFLIPSDFLSLKNGSPNVLLIKLIRLETFLQLCETMKRSTELTILIDTGGVGTEFYSFAEKNLQAVTLPHKDKEACQRILKLTNDSLLMSRTAPNGGTVHVRLCRYKHLTYKPRFQTLQSPFSQQEWGYRELDLSQFINNLKILCPNITVEIEYD